MKNGTGDLISEEFGDIAFTMMKLSLILHINAENSLTNATNKFINKCVDVFTLAEGKGQNLCDISTAERVALWRNIE